MSNLANNYINQIMNENERKANLALKRQVLVTIMQISINYINILMDEFTVFKPARTESYKSVINLIDDINDLIQANNQKIKDKSIEEILPVVETIITKVTILTECLFETLEISKFKEKKQYLLLELKHQWNQKVVATFKITDIFKNQKLPLYIKDIQEEINEIDLINQLIDSWTDTFSFISENQNFKNEDKKNFIEQKLDITSKKLSHFYDISVALLKNKIAEEKYQEQQHLVKNNNDLQFLNQAALSLKEKYEMIYDNLLQNINYDFEAKEKSVKKAGDIAKNILEGKIDNPLKKELLTKRWFSLWFNQADETARIKVTDYLDTTQQVNYALLDEILETASKLSQVPYIKK